MAESKPTDSQPTDSKPADRKQKRTNLLVLIGGALAAVAFAFGAVLIASEALFHNHNPYSAIVTYMVIPIAIGVGLAVALIGFVIELRWRRRHPGGERHLPVLDLNRQRTRRILVIFVVGTAIFFAVSAVATYRGFVYTESTEFCGVVCHQVMEPEYTAHQQSPHARVACVECHIGEGAEFYVRSKMSGLRQVYRTLTNSYELPIQVPIANLRPARETCERCHWPQMFTGSIERVRWHFWYDDANTPSRYNMLMHVGGTDPSTGEARGIHWHTNQVVRYWASDRERLDIPWVEVTNDDGTTTVFRSEGAPEGRPPEAEIRVMDCIDCHNRPAHQYPNPAELVNHDLSGGQIDRSLPEVKALSVDTLNVGYADRDTAHQAIQTALEERYPAAQYDPATVSQAISSLVTIYDRTHFPDQRIDWRTYPDHIGHMYSPGCFRCHDDQHRAEGGEEVIGMDCSQCHDFIFQASGDAAFGPTTYQSGPFQHPEGEPDMHEGFLCMDCHGPEEEDE